MAKYEIPGYTAITLNGRTRHFRRITSLKMIVRGRYDIETNSEFWGKCTLEGGRSRGGKRSDWFLETNIGEANRNPKAMHCTSVMDALNMIENS